jgi:AcrR family transcriptional regulator
MNRAGQDQFTISISDISAAFGISRTTLWRLFRGQEMLHARYAGVKHFAVSDVIARLRQRQKHDPVSEITLLTTDIDRRKKRQQEAQENGI